MGGGICGDAVIPKLFVKQPKSSLARLVLALVRANDDVHYNAPPLLQGGQPLLLQIVCSKVSLKRGSQNRPQYIIVLLIGTSK